MNSREQAHFDLVKRVGVFGTNNITNFNSLAKQLVLDLTTKDSGLIDQIGNTAEAQQFGAGEYHGGTSSKGLLREELREELRAINRTAFAIAAATDRPALKKIFKMPPHVSDITLVAKAGAMADAAEAMAAEFIDYAHSPKFVQELRTLITNFDQAEDVQDTGGQERSGATAKLRPLLKEAMTKVKQLDAFVHNYYKNNPEKLREWKTASHLKAAPQKKTQPTPAATEAQPTPASDGQHVAEAVNGSAGAEFPDRKSVV